MKRQIVVLLCLFTGIGSLLAAELPAPLPPTLSNVSYGPHARNVLDFWKAGGAGPRPLLVYVHGGGWITGDKGQKGPAFQPFLDRGISCAPSITWIPTIRHCL